jgi:serine phosphatase RsbU (regulator of sigma subunit)
MIIIQENKGNHGLSDVNLGFLDTLWNKYNFIRIRGTKLWYQVTEFSRWFEFDAADLAKKKNQDQIWIDLDTDGNVKRLRAGQLEDYEYLLQYHILWEYLASLGIHKLCLDPRLEMNQIQDLFIFLKSQERALRSRGKKRNRSVSAAFQKGKSIHCSCAHLTLQDDVLFAKYSYCTLKYSSLVHWLERRNKSFRDHRSLFQMAPRYGILLAALILAPPLLLAGMHEEWYIFSLLAVAAVALYWITFLFLMVVGSVEYDNEEKNYRLSRAYAQLQVYASRIQADIKRAQTIQQCFLPDTSKMPLSDRVDWASSYIPAEEVGGDFFDVQHLDDDRAVIVFGDVCGHGMAAALITAVLKTTFQEWIGNPTGLEKLAAQLNRNIYHMTPMGDFAAVFLAILNGKTGQLDYINCGHNPEPWVLPPAANGPVTQLDAAGCMILGIEEQMDITTSSMALKPGDGILIVSDGIIENQDIEGNLYSQERFEALLRDNRAMHVLELKTLITGQAKAFSKDADLKDDQTLLGFRLKPV